MVRNNACKILTCGMHAAFTVSTFYSQLHLRGLPLNMLAPSESLPSNARTCVGDDLFGVYQQQRVIVVVHRKGVVLRLVARQVDGPCK